MQHTAIGAAAAQATDAEFADQIAAFTTLSKDEIATLFPTQNDQTELSALIDVIRSSTNDNERTAKLVAGIDKLGSAVVKLLKSRAIPSA